MAQKEKKMPRVQKIAAVPIAKLKKNGKFVEFGRDGTVVFQLAYKDGRSKKKTDQTWRIPMSVVGVVEMEKMVADTERKKPGRKPKEEKTQKKRGPKPKNGRKKPGRKAKKKPGPKPKNGRKKPGRKAKKKAEKDAAPRKRRTRKERTPAEKGKKTAKRKTRKKKMSIPWGEEEEFEDEL